MSGRYGTKALWLAYATVGLMTTSCKQTSNVNVDNSPQQIEPIEPNPEDALALVNTGSKALADIARQPELVPHDADHKFTPKSLMIDGDGTQHVRFTRTYKGLNVVGGDFVVHRLGNISSTTLNKISNKSAVVKNSGSSTPTTGSEKINLDIVPKITAQTALENARSKFIGQLKAIKSPQLIVFNHNKSPTLAWEVEVVGTKPNRTPSNLRMFIDAQTGTLLNRWEKIHTVAATGKGFHSGAVKIEAQLLNGFYRLMDSTRGNSQTGDMKGQEDGWFEHPKVVPPFAQKSSVFGDFKPQTLATTAADVHFGALASWDYFLKVHGRRGLRNDGRGILSRFNYGVNYANAFYHPDCDCLTYGNGDGSSVNPLTALDVTVHEFSHGVTRYSADLIYEGESGGLNESTSDIFGTLAELYFNLPSDRPDYLIGEKIMMPNIVPNNALRTMYKPSLDGISPDCYSEEVQKMDVHHSSGIGNHFFYLLAEGSAPAAPMPESPTCDGSAIMGIGRGKAGKIWYRALTAYMTSSTDYSGAKFATLRASHDLFGVNAPETMTVGAAWAAVKLPNTAPVIPNIAPITARRNSTTAVKIKVKDEDSPINCVESIRLSSSNPKLLPLRSIVMTGKAPNCVLSITPGKSSTGKTTIGIEVKDEKLSVSKSISVTVK